MRKFFFFLILSTALILTGVILHREPEITPTSMASEYNEGELITFASALNRNVMDVTGSDGSGHAVHCSETLLGYGGETVYYFGVDQIITRICFFFPENTNWNDAANRISEQLGEASLAMQYEDGGANAQWESSESLFCLSTDGKIITLTITKYYGAND